MLYECCEKTLAALTTTIDNHIEAENGSSMASPEKPLATVDPEEVERVVENVSAVLQDAPLQADEDVEEEQRDVMKMNTEDSVMSAAGGEPAQ